MIKTLSVNVNSEILILYIDEFSLSKVISNLIYVNKYCFTKSINEVFIET